MIVGISLIQSRCMTCTETEGILGRALIVTSDSREAERLRDQVRVRYEMPSVIVGCLTQARTSLERDGLPELIIVDEDLPSTEEDLEVVRQAEIAIGQIRKKIQSAITTEEEKQARTQCTIECEIMARAVKTSGGIIFLEEVRAEERGKQHIPVLLLTNGGDDSRHLFRRILDVGGKSTDWETRDARISLITEKCDRLLRAAH